MSDLNQTNLTPEENNDVPKDNLKGQSDDLSKNLDAPAQMKKEAEKILETLNSANKMGRCDMSIETTRMGTQKINITRKGIKKRAEPQIAIVIYEPGKARVKLNPYDHYEGHYYYLEKSINDDDFYQYLSGFIKQAGVDGAGGTLVFEKELSRPGIEKVEYPNMDD